MAKVGQYSHGSTITSDVAGIGNTFDITKFHLHQLTIPNTQFTNQIEGLYVRVTNLGLGTTKITARLCCDIDGDYTFLPDTEADIAVGLTTATTGVAVWEFGIPLNQFFGKSEVYLFIKTNGSCTLANSCIVWKE